MGEQLADDAGALLGRLARPEHRLGHALAQGAVVVDEGVADVGERQPAQPGDDLVGARSARRRGRRAAPAASLRPRRHAARNCDRPASDGRVGSRGRADMASRPISRVGFFGPFGTFTEQAVRTQADLAAAELVDFVTVPDVLDAVAVR